MSYKSYTCALQFNASCDLAHNSAFHLFLNDQTFLYIYNQLIIWCTVNSDTLPKCDQAHTKLKPRALCHKSYIIYLLSYIKLTMTACLLMPSLVFCL